MVCHGFVRALSRHFADAGSTMPPGEDVIRFALDGIRDRIAMAARRAHRSRRAFAATLVAVIAAPNWTVLVHVGDGACAISTTPHGPWLVPSWPYHGEYASSTAFVTQDPEPRLCVSHLPHAISRFALFSDGLERLVLDHQRQVAFAPFFDRMLDPLQRAMTIGKDRALSGALRRFLSSKAVTDRTDDDTSMIMGFRR
jgi:Protein phosphatase 2C